MRDKVLQVEAALDLVRCTAEVCPGLQWSRVPSSVVAVVTAVQSKL